MCVCICGLCVYVWFVCMCGVCVCVDCVCVVCVCMMYTFVSVHVCMRDSGMCVNTLCAYKHIHVHV